MEKVGHDHEIVGSCACGRNKYHILLPHGERKYSKIELIQDPIYHSNRRNTSTQTYLRVPLAWMNSTTYALFDDETHAQIRKSFTHPKQEGTKRHFCGFCGVQLSLWSEEPSEEADFLCVAFGTIKPDSIDVLEELGFVENEEGDVVMGLDREMSEERPGKKRKRGVERIVDGGRVEWEVVEYESPDGTVQISSSTFTRTELPITQGIGGSIHP